MSLFSNQTHLVFVWDKRYIYLYLLVYVIKLVLEFNGTEVRFAVTCHIYHSVHIRLKGYSSQKTLLYKICNYLFKRL